MKTILYFEPIIPEQRAVLEENVPEGFKVVFWRELDEKAQEEAISQAEYFFIVGQKTTEELIRRAPRLVHIQRSGIGWDNVDVDFADKQGITVSNIPTGNATAVAEHGILLPLALYRHLIEINRETKNGEWPVWKYRTTSYEMEGKTHGFIGFGNIARRIAYRSQAFGTNIIYYDMYRLSEDREKELGVTYMSMDDVLKNADILSVNVPMLPGNRGLIGRREIGLMKQGALLINVSRGGLVDEEALYDALVSGQLAGAGIDTWADEPNIQGNPLLALDNVIATSHVAAATSDTFKKQVQAGFANILKASIDGKPDFAVGAVKTCRQVNEI